MKDDFFEGMEFDNTAIDYNQPCEFIVKNGVLKKVKNLVCKKELIIPEGVVKLDNHIFDVVETMDLEKIVFPSTLQDIGEDNFVDIRNLKEVVTNNNFVIKDSCLYSSDYKKLYFCLKNTKTINELYVKDGCDEIYPFAFANCAAILKIILPESIKRIGNCAFDGCLNLKEIVLPKYIDNIGDFTFANCDMLEKINLPENLEIISAELFSCCNNLKELFLPNSINKIECDDDFEFVCENTVLLVNKENKIAIDYAKKHKHKFQIIEE